MDPSIALRPKKALRSLLNRTGIKVDRNEFVVEERTSSPRPTQEDESGVDSNVNNNVDTNASANVDLDAAPQYIWVRPDVDEQGRSNNRRHLKDNIDPIIRVKVDTVHEMKRLDVNALVEDWEKKEFYDKTSFASYEDRIQGIIDALDSWYMTWGLDDEWGGQVLFQECVYGKFHGIHIVRDAEDGPDESSAAPSGDLDDELWNLARPADDDSDEHDDDESDERHDDENQDDDFFHDLFDDAPHDDDDAAHDEDDKADDDYNSLFDGDEERDDGHDDLYAPPSPRRSSRNEDARDLVDFNNNTGEQSYEPDTFAQSNGHGVTSGLSTAFLEQEEDVQLPSASPFLSQHGSQMGFVPASTITQDDEEMEYEEDHGQLQVGFQSGLAGEHQEEDDNDAAMDDAPPSDQGTKNFALPGNGHYNDQDMEDEQEAPVSAVLPPISTKAVEDPIAQASKSTPLSFGAISSGPAPLFNTSGFNFGAPVAGLSLPKSGIKVDFGVSTLDLSSLQRSYAGPAYVPKPSLFEKCVPPVDPQVTEDLASREPATPQHTLQSPSPTPQVTEELQATSSADRPGPTIDDVSGTTQREVAGADTTAIASPLAEQRAPAPEVKQADALSAQVKQLKDHHATMVREMLARIKALSAEISNAEQPGLEHHQEELRVLEQWHTQTLVDLEVKAKPQGQIIDKMDVASRMATVPEEQDAVAYEHQSTSGMAAVPEEHDQVVADLQDTSGMAIVPEEQGQGGVPVEAAPGPVATVSGPTETPAQVAEDISSQDAVDAGTGAVSEQPTPQLPVVEESGAVAVELSNESSQQAVSNQRTKSVREEERDALRLQRSTPSQQPPRLRRRRKTALLATKIERFISEWEARIEKGLPDAICDFVEDLIDEYRGMDKPEPFRAVRALFNRWVAIRNLIRTYDNLVKSFGPAARERMNAQYLERRDTWPGPRQTRLDEALKKKLAAMERRASRFLDMALKLRDRVPFEDEPALGKLVQITLTECQQVGEAAWRGLRAMEDDEEL
jgi:hypothetical protein